MVSWYKTIDYFVMRGLLMLYRIIKFRCCFFYKVVSSLRFHLFYGVKVKGWSSNTDMAASVEIVFVIWWGRNVRSISMLFMMIAVHVSYSMRIWMCSFLIHSSASPKWTFHFHINFMNANACHTQIRISMEIMIWRAVLNWHIPEIL